jgi:hypothetical protein
MTESPELRDRCKTVVNMHRRAGRTVEEIAADIPCHRDTLYKFLAGEIQNPSHPMRAAMEKFVSKASNLRQPSNEDA